MSRSKQQLNPWKQISSEVVYSNPWYYVRRDVVIQPNGKQGEYNVVERPPAIFIAALDNKQNIHLIQLFRYTINQFSIEIPAGGLENSEKPLLAAKRELQEETGLKAKKWKQLGKIHLANGFLNQCGYVFLAQELTQTLENEQLEEGIQGVTKLSLKEAFSLVDKGKITDSQTIAALTMVDRYLKANKK
jgi:8-oxo-dGTP pyrophosphatase MutT (NUDIX family)